MGTEYERRRHNDIPGFRSPGTHFAFKNGWLVRLLESDPTSSKLTYDVSIYEASFVQLALPREAADKIKSVDSDTLVRLLAVVQGFPEKISEADAVAQVTAAL